VQRIDLGHQWFDTLALERQHQPRAVILQSAHPVRMRQRRRQVIQIRLKIIRLHLTTLLLPAAIRRQSFPKNPPFGQTSCQAMTLRNPLKTAPVFAFTTYDAVVLVPTLRAGEVVVMDNLSVHKVCRYWSAYHRSRRAIDLPATVFARLVADRAMLVQAENLVAQYESPDPRGA
jgi:hypothetical protein